MRHTGGQCHCALFSEVRILGVAAFTRKPHAHQNGEHRRIAACDVRARSQYVTTLMVYAVCTHSRTCTNKMVLVLMKWCLDLTMVPVLILVLRLIKWYLNLLEWYLDLCNGTYERVFVLIQLIKQYLYLYNGTCSHKMVLVHKTWYLYL